MGRKIKAVVIKGNNVKEKDKNILLFSLEEGKIWATLKGVRGEKAKMKYAKEPFCFGDFILEEGKAGDIVTSVDVIETFHEITNDIDKYFEGNALLEIVSQVDDSAERYGIFMNFVKALKILCFHKVPKLEVLVKFMLDLFSLLGVGLYTKKCSCCGVDFHDNLYINYNVGEIVCSQCKTFQSEQLSKAEFSIIKILSEIDYEKLASTKFSEETLFRLLKILVKNFSARFDRNLKMIGILS